MKYPYLSQVGQRYSSEVGTSGVRQDALEPLAVKLRTAMADLKSALATSPSVQPVVPPSGGGVKALIKLHESQQKEAGPGEIERLRAKMEQLRQWLTRQGVLVGRDGEILWQEDTAKVVVYDRDLTAQGMTRIRFSGGRLFWDDNHLNPLDTTRMMTHFSGPGYAIYVMSKEGNIHVSSHSVGHRHHSSLLAGGNVAGAGELKAINGWLAYLSNKSGHYAPNLDHLIQTLHQLDKHGVPMTFEILHVVSRVEQHSYRNADALIKALQLDEQPDYELNKLLAYHTDLTDKVLLRHSPNPWKWRWDPANQKPGVYDLVTFEMVPHKAVRTRLKRDQGLFAKEELQSGCFR